MQEKLSLLTYSSSASAEYLLNCFVSNAEQNSAKHQPELSYGATSGVTSFRTTTGYMV